MDKEFKQLLKSWEGKKGNVIPLLQETQVGKAYDEGLPRYGGSIEIVRKESVFASEAKTVLPVRCWRNYAPIFPPITKCMYCLIVGIHQRN